MMRMLRSAALTLVALHGACAGRSSQHDSAGGTGMAGVSNAGSSGALAMAGGGATIAGSGATMAGGGASSGGNETAGGSGTAEGGSSDADGGAALAGSSAGGADNQAGAATGEAGGPALACPSGCSPTGSAAFCQDGGVTWVCSGPGPIDYDALTHGGCTDLATQVPRFCCPASFRPECQ